MDLKSTGKYIAEKRKELNLTQLQLADILLISEKTVSKWECGKGFPDTSLILPLCSALRVNANELLSGKNLSEQDYKPTAENNLIELKNKSLKSDKFLLLSEWFIGCYSLITFFTFILMASYLNVADVWRFVFIIIALITLFPGLTVCLLIEQRAGYYKCKHCAHIYIPSFKSILLARHIGRIRYLKCPKCGNKSWHKKTVEKE